MSISEVSISRRLFEFEVPTVHKKSCKFDFLQKQLTRLVLYKSDNMLILVSPGKIEKLQNRSRTITGAKEDCNLPKSQFHDFGRNVNYFTQSQIIIKNVCMWMCLCVYLLHGLTLKPMGRLE